MKKKIKAEEYMNWDKNLAKELSPLEALKRIRKNLTRYSDSDDEPYLFQQDKLDLDIIEKALKEVSGEDKAFLRHVKTGKLHPLTTKYYQSLLEKQKALEIIKNHFELIEKMYDTKLIIKIPLTQEECDLLKEVLLK